MLDRLRSLRVQNGAVLRNRHLHVDVPSLAPYSRLTEDQIEEPAPVRRNLLDTYGERVYGMVVRYDDEETVSAANLRKVLNGKTRVLTDRAGVGHPRAFARIRLDHGDALVSIHVDRDAKRLHILGWDPASSNTSSTTKLTNDDVEDLHKHLGGIIDILKQRSLVAANAAKTTPQPVLEMIEAKDLELPDRPWEQVRFVAQEPSSSSQ